MFSPVTHSRMYSELAHIHAELLYEFSLTLIFFLFFSFLPFQVNVDDTIEMLPKSRRALTIQEIAALARSSLHGECCMILYMVKTPDRCEVMLRSNP